MSDFFPSGISLDDTASPLEILETAKQEWEERTDGVLTLIIQSAKSRNGDPTLIVHAKHAPSNRTVQLLSVVHRPAAHYPANIQPRNDELPEFLKKSYWRPGFMESLSPEVEYENGRQVENEWVCESPAEFREKLKAAFNLGAIKADVISLVSGTASSTAGDATAGKP